MANDYKQLTLDEKLRLLTGKNVWEFMYYPGKVNQLKMSDGPCGLRKVSHDGGEGKQESFKATAMPAPSVLSNSWSRETVKKVASGIADDCIEQDVDVLLAVGVNLKRDPRCGRNFEYFSEDAYLAGTLAKEFLDGVQEKGVGTSLKHYCANNTERDRLWSSSNVDLRTLNELYLYPFELATKANPTTVMSSYNLVNGTHTAENDYLTKILRNRFSFKGVYVSDWNACHNRSKALLATCDVDMPYVDDSYINLKKGLEDGYITEADVDASCQRICNLLNWVEDNKPLRVKTTDLTSRHAIAKEGALEGAVLLKNDGILPLKTGKNIAVFGKFDGENIAGGGSARVNPYVDALPLNKTIPMVDPTANIFDKSYGYIFGYSKAMCDYDNLPLALEIAKDKDYIVIHASTSYAIESEQHDRQSIKFDPYIEDFINKIAKINPNVIVVMYAGSVIDVSAWEKSAKAILYAGFAGEAVNEAVSELLFGKVSPSGKLSETFINKLEDSFAYQIGYGDYGVDYKEGLLLGYRYYDKKKVKVRYPFGYGLSYAKFTYSNLSVTEKDGNLYATFDVKNDSDVSAKEVVQVYVGYQKAGKDEPIRTLAGFDKHYIEAGKTKTITVQINPRAFEFYNVSTEEFEVKHGKYDVFVGGSSKDLPLSAVILK
ncbi:MAG: glycoside hydrolase family 3 C-terminal domain-containing protein [Clostridia bacterium]|nr:glycoside hydrolase family 3 C-terminal domain-containing protein [Clostridia bacterium]